MNRRIKNVSGNQQNQLSREAPTAVYLGLLLHDLTASKALIDALSWLGLSILYNRVQEIRKSLSTQIVHGCWSSLDLFIT